MSCAPHWDEMLSEAAHGTLDGESQATLAAHLPTCPACSATLGELRETLARAHRQLPARLTAEELDAWPSIAVRLTSPAPAPRAPTLPLAPALAAGLMLLVVGIGIGRFSNHPASPPVADTSEALISPDEQELTLAYASFLERSTPLLLSVANRGDGLLLRQVGFEAATSEQRLAADLARAARELQGRLASTDRKRESKLVAQLQVVFLQLANLPAEDYDATLWLVRNSIEERGLLFQLTVEQMRRHRTQRRLPTQAHGEQPDA